MPTQNATALAHLIAEAIERKAPSETVPQIVERVAVPPSVAVPGRFRGWVDEVSVTGIRAFRDRESVRLSRGLTIVYAENGSGKTSFVDALELLTAGGTTRGRQFPDIRNEVKDEDHVLHADGNGELVGPSPAVSATWFEAADATPQEARWIGAWGTPGSAAPPIHLLARRRLRELIAIRGADRAERLAQSVGLDVLAVTWVDAATVLRDGAKRIREQAVPTDVPADDVSWVSGMVLADASAEEIEQLIRRQATSGSMLSSPDRDGHLEKALAETYIAPPVLADAAVFEQASGRLQEPADRTHTGNAAARGDLAHLQFLRAYLAEGQPDKTCPGCEDGVLSASRAEQIAQQIEAIEQEHTAQRLRQEALQAARELVERTARQSRAWRLELDAIVPAAPRPLSAVEEFLKLRSALLARLLAWQQDVQSLDDKLDRAAGTHLTASSLARVGEALAELAELRERIVLELSAIDEARVRARQEHQTATPSPESVIARRRLGNAARLASVAVAMRAASELADQYESAATALRTHVTHVINERASTLADPINAWLARLAPEHTPSILVRARRTSGRPALDVVVAGGTVKAVGRLSDSQLDMLGLAAHLATLESEAPGQPVVIDDPTDMLDRATRARFADEAVARLLGTDESPGRQVVVLTHDDELVQALWTHHGHRSPCTLQVAIELVSDGTSARATFVPRSPQELLQRVVDLLKANVNNRNRLWLRAAAGNQIRQALELLAKDLLTVLGSAGIGSPYAPALPLTGSASVGAAFDSLEPALVEINRTQRSCGAPRHRQAIFETARVMDIFARRKQYLLDEASHADFVYPSVREIEQLATQMSIACRSLAPGRGEAADTWPQTCQWAKHLELCPDCVGSA
ncbi:AAA family ATPase [Patulibacter sp. S7RM1-6]